jgi:hypothetical protein
MYAYCYVFLLLCYVLYILYHSVALCIVLCYIVINLFFNNQPDALIIQIYSVIKLCLEAVIKNLHEIYQCRMYSRELLMMGREDARNM